MSFARLAAQLVLASASVVSKAFLQAYAQGKAGGGAVSRAAAAAGRMPADQAREVLQVGKGALSREDVVSQATKYYDANDPVKGGSFYIQSKVWNARETLLEDLRRQERAAAAKGGPPPPGGGSGGAGGGDRGR